jgi:hypothetical protein
LSDLVDRARKVACIEKFFRAHWHLVVRNLSLVYFNCGDSATPGRGLSLPPFRFDRRISATTF